MKSYKPNTVMIILLLIVILLCSAVFVHTRSYRSAKNWMNYGGEGITFQYPASWKMNLCGKGADEIVLPNTIKGEYKSRHYNDRDNPMSQRNLQIAGYSSMDCLGGSATVTGHESTKEDCSEDEGVVALSNDMVVNYSIDQKQNVTRIYISKNACSMYSLFTFYFRDPSEQGDSREELGHYGSGMIQKDYLLSTPQYKDIVKFAESIQIKTSQ